MLVKTSTAAACKIIAQYPRLLDDVLAAIAKLLDELFDGLHRPKTLVGTLKGFWSIRINQKDRLVYKVEGKRLLIASIEGHCNDH